MTLFRETRRDVNQQTSPNPRKKQVETFVRSMTDRESGTPFVYDMPDSTGRYPIMERKQAACPTQSPCRLPQVVLYYSVATSEVHVRMNFMN